VKQVRYIGIMKRAGILFLGFFLLWALLACSTTSGSLLEDTAKRDKKDAARSSQPSDGYEEEEEENGGSSFFGALAHALATDEEDTGLSIRSNPSGANVFLNNRYMGITPLIIDDIDPGHYKITLKLNGYYSESEWITYTGNYKSYYFNLDQITGFLKVDVFPPDAELYYGSIWVPADRLHELAVGLRTVRVRAFGYEEESLSVQIYERRVTRLSVTLREADFGISRLQSNRRIFNPRNSGLLGSARISFEVSNYGSGRALIFDAQDQMVFSRDLGRFDTWQQGFEWDGRGTDGTPLPDGRYTVRIEAEGKQAGERDSAELGVLIDSSIVLLFRSLWSGSAGLLYAPSADILPGGSVQLSSLVLAHASGGGSEAIVRAPVNLGMRVGLGQRNLFELDTSVGGIIGYIDETFSLPWFASAAFKASLLRPTRTFDLSSAAQVKFTYQNTHTDTLANFRGLSVGLPTGLHLGPLTLLFSPEVILSWQAVSYDEDYTPDPAAYGWIYGRFGLLVDFPPFSAGASLSLRSLPFNQGFGLDYPFQTAVEAHWLLPNTQLFLSTSLAGEFRNSQDYYLLGGFGLGILN
jgi:hypothetical protein